MAMPIILDVNSPQWTPEQLEKLKQDNARGITYQGRHYTGYEAQQKQRQLERAIRTQKNRILTAEATGDKERLQTAQIRLGMLNREYREFSQAAGLRTQTQRAQVVGFGRNQAARAKEAAKTVEISGKPAIMEPRTQDREENMVHSVTRLDIEKYRCVSENITTDEVIITEERIQHIRERHPNDYERYMQYMPDMIADPDYIIEANKANTAVLLKEYMQDDERFKLILRLRAETDPGDYKNSVISFWKVGETTWRKNLKNKKVLYKRE